MIDWKQKARELAEEIFPYEPVWPVIKGDNRVAIACSGGADSVFLLLLAWSYTNAWNSWPHSGVLHINHGMRGEESDGDAAFVQSIAEVLGMPYHVKKLDDLPDSPSEAWLREQRLAFYRESGFPHIMQGHHANDIAETVLMRLTRGSGTEGLAVPKYMQRFNDWLCVYRPILGFTRTQIVKALTACGIPWREDASNTSPNYFRNRVRSDVLPRLVDVSPTNAMAGFTRSHKLLNEDAQALNEWLDSHKLTYEKDEKLDLKPLHGKPLALLRRAIQRWLMVQAIDLKAKMVDELVYGAYLQGELRISIGPNRYVVLKLKELRVETTTEPPRASDSIMLTAGQSVDFVERSFCYESLMLDETERGRILTGQYSNVSIAFIDEKQVVPPLTIGSWHDGSRYRPLGAPGTKKLQDCFTDAKIPAAERRRLPVVCDHNGNILWVPGLPPAEHAKITAQTESALRLTYRAD